MTNKKPPSKVRPYLFILTKISPSDTRRSPRFDTKEELVDYIIDFIALQSSLFVSTSWGMRILEEFKKILLEVDSKQFSEMDIMQKSNILLDFLKIVPKDQDPPDEFDRQLLDQLS